MTLRQDGGCTPRADVGGRVILRQDGVPQGAAVQLEPMKPVLRAPRSMPLKLIYDGPLSNLAFNFNLRRYMKVLKGALTELCNKAGRCRLTLG